MTNGMDMEPLYPSGLPIDKRYPDLRRFSHTAMTTVFEVLVLHEDLHYARQAAGEAFDLVDRIELELSRYHPNSDVSRINRMEPGQSLHLGLHAFACLQKSRELFEDTSGAFDVTAGPLKDFWTGVSPGILSAAVQVGMDHLHLDENGCTVWMDQTVRVDLGAIGKGYAVDRMGDLFLEWDIGTVLIHGGRSSLLALGCPPGLTGWPVTLSHPANRRRTLSRPILQNRAAGGSGLERGLHIVNPHTRRPARDQLAAWVIAGDAATADALSTAFMVFGPQEADLYCRRHPGIQALVLRKAVREGEDILRWGL